MIQVGDDTIKIPQPDAQILLITPKYIESDIYKAERDKFTVFINEVIDTTSKKRINENIFYRSTLLWQINTSKILFRTI